MPDNCGGCINMKNKSQTWGFSGYYEKWVCTHSAWREYTDKYRQIYDTHYIPEWCPLKEAK
jgi:hypothetical protein